MRLLLIFLLCVLVVALAFHALFSYDVWTHLAAGRLIIANHSVPQSDPFSYTLADKPWIDHEWLFQVILYPVYLLGGVSALNLFRVALVLAVFLVLLLALECRSVHLLVIFVLVAAVMSSYTRFQMRPELASFLLFALTLVILNRFDGDPSTRVLFLLPVLQLLWVNVHGFFILGPLSLLFFILARWLALKTPRAFAWLAVGVLSVSAGLFFAAWTPATATLYVLLFLAAVVASLILAGRQPARRPVCPAHVPGFPRLFLVLGLMILACFVNPYGYRGALYPFGVASQLLDRASFIYLVAELVPTLSYLTLAQTFWFKLLSLIVLLSFILNFRRASLWTALLVGLSWPFSVAALRNVPIFAIVGALAASVNLSQWWTAQGESLLMRLRSPRARFAGSLVLQSALALLILWLTFNVVTDRRNILDRTGVRFGSGLSNIKFSEPAMDFIRRNRLHGPLFNNQAIGGFLMFSLPDEKVFIDGRMELYDPAFHEAWVACMTAPHAFKNAARKWGFNTVVLTKGSYDALDLAAWLYRDPDWRLIFMDSASWIFVRNTPANAPLIASTSRAFDFSVRDKRPLVPESEARPQLPAPGDLRDNFAAELIDIDWFCRLGFTNLAENCLDRFLPWSGDIPDVQFRAASVYQFQADRLSNRELPNLSGVAFDTAMKRMDDYFAKTEAAYERLSRLQPVYPGLYTSQANFYANIRKLDLARASLEKALRTEYHSRAFLNQCASFALTRLNDPLWARELANEAENPTW